MIISQKTHFLFFQKLWTTCGTKFPGKYKKSTLKTNQFSKLWPSDSFSAKWPKMVIFAHFSVLGHQTTMNTRLDELSYISLSGIHNFNPLPGHKGANNPILWWKITKNGYFQIYTSESIRRSQFLNLNYITSFVATQMLIMDSNVCSILWYDSKAKNYGIVIIWC